MKTVLILDFTFFFTPPNLRQSAFVLIFANLILVQFVDLNEI